jgi:hypothetical protein
MIDQVFASGRGGGCTWETGSASTAEGLPTNAGRKLKSSRFVETDDIGRIMRPADATRQKPARSGKIHGHQLKTACN